MLPRQVLPLALFVLLRTNFVGAFVPTSSLSFVTPATLRPPTPLFADKKSDNEPPKKKRRKKKKPNKPDKEQMKEQVAKAAAELRQDKEEKQGGLLDMLNPFQAGQKVRRTIDTALTTLGSTGGLSQERRSVYFVDDRFNEPIFSERNPLMDRMVEDGYVPEVLVVGATGEVGRLVVRQLLLDGRFRVRVLVRDLYSKTLNLLGTGVTYCQGDLANVESLEYALTDVDKIVFCAGVPRPDEADFAEKFQSFCQENLSNTTEEDVEWEQLESVLQVRAKLAEQIDCIGMQNLVRAFQNVRHADFGTSQAAKRSLFKFQDRPEDFNLFAIDEEGDELEDTDESFAGNEEIAKAYEQPEEYDYEDDYDEYEYDEYEDEEEYATTTTRKGSAVKTQIQWIRNKFEHGVFVGKVPKEVSGVGGGEAAIVSSRLRSRDEPENGIDLSNGFAGFLCRVCSDGGRFEAFVRTAEYETDGIEYVCEFRTENKPRQRGNKSRNKFVTVRLPFANFKPVKRREEGGEERVVPPFKGRDVRQLGFRYRSESNPEKAKYEKGDLSSFYLAFCYIKVYRQQPEPEFVYLSDSRIPPVIKNNMVRHNIRRIVVDEDAGDTSYKLLDQATLESATDIAMDRIAEETYYKYRGEEILKNSGLSYAIVRVAGYNESPSGETSTLELAQSNDDMSAVSRAEVAQVCSSALLDPNALNKSFYVSKTKRKSKDLSREEDMSVKFSLLPADP